MSFNYWKALGETVKKDWEVKVGAPPSMKVMSDFRGGLSTLSDPTEIYPEYIREKRSALEEVIADYKFSDPKDFYPSSPFGGFSTTTTTYSEIGKALTADDLEKFIEDMKGGGTLESYGTAWTDGTGIKDLGGATGSPMGECVIPGCHTNSEHRADYGDYLCYKHYEVYKSNKESK